MAISGAFSLPMTLQVLLTVLKRLHWGYTLTLFKNTDNDLRLCEYEETIVEVATRMLIVVIAGCVAYLVPHFSLLMALLGSITAVLLTLLFPVLFWFSNVSSKKVKVGECVIFLFGIRKQ